MHNVLFVILAIAAAVTLVAAAVDLAKGKARPCDVVGVTGVTLAILAAFGWLAYAGISWLSQHPWGWLLLIGFIVVTFCIWFVVGVTGLLVRLLYRD